MKYLLKNYISHLRETLNLPYIEQNLDPLRSQIAEQEIRMAATQALVMNQQNMLMDRISRVQEDLDKLILLHGNGNSTENDITEIQAKIRNDRDHQ